MFGLKKALIQNKIEGLRFQRRARILRRRMGFLLKKIPHLPKTSHAAGMARNILKSEKRMGRFLEDPVHIPLTNNHAERQIRHYVTYRKNSYFTQSEPGNRFLERVMSLYLTCQTAEN